LADSEEATLLRRRARRRLVGAIALVVFAVIVLPIVFDKEPRPISQDIVIQIPSQNSSRFNTKVAPAAPEPAKGGVGDAEKAAAPVPPPPAAPIASAVEAPKDAATAKAPEPVKAKAQEPAKAEAAGKPADIKAAVAAKGVAPATERPADAEASRAQSALQGDSYVVPLGAFLNQANVKTLQAKVTVAGFKSYSEIQKVAKGEQIRVRAGPFPSREAAERAREQLQATGLTVGPVTKL
jgi:DedD protein